jgi:hypothetical protein
MQQFTLSFCRGEKAENLARHIGLFHGKLDEFLHDDDFVAQKRAEKQLRASERTADVRCVVCDESMARCDKFHERAQSESIFAPIIQNLPNGVARDGKISTVTPVI